MEPTSEKGNTHLHLQNVPGQITHLPQKTLQLRWRVFTELNIISRIDLHDGLPWLPDRWQEGVNLGQPWNHPCVWIHCYVLCLTVTVNSRHFYFYKHTHRNCRCVYKNYFFHSKCINHLNLKKVIKVKHSHNVGETALRSASVRYCPLDGAADAWVFTSFIGVYCFVWTYMYISSSVSLEGHVFFCSIYY